MEARTEDWRGRATRLSLAVVVHIIAVILAYFLSPPITFKKPSPDLQVVMLPAPAPKKASAQHAKAREQQHTMVQPPKPPSQQVDTTHTPLNMMYVSSEVFRASDISKIRSAPAAPSMADDDGSIGEAPGGGKLYDAEWYRVPTDAEIDPYLPKNAHTGYGMIVCRTAAEYHVEDCRELEEEPMGSGLARSMRLASWQFRVRPKRLGAKNLIGTWVRIRFDLIERERARN